MTAEVGTIASSTASLVGGTPSGHVSATNPAAEIAGGSAAGNGGSSGMDGKIKALDQGNKAANDAKGSDAICAACKSDTKAEKKPAQERKKYKTAKEAALAAVKEANPKSIDANKEFAE